MSWFKVSDDYIDHPKARRAGRDGRALWFAAGNRCARYNTDGLVEGVLLKDYAALAEVRGHVATARRLVEVGLWHDHESLKKCQGCKDAIAEVNRDRRADGDPLLVVGPDDFYFHQWLDHQPPKKSKQSVAAKMAADRKRDLSKARDLCEAIQLRDRDRCRFCGDRVDWKDRRGPKGATYDHLDPDCYTPNGGNFLDGIVVACRECNGRKGRRTVQEWVEVGGMELLPAPTQQVASANLVSNAPLDPSDPTPGGASDQVTTGSPPDGGSSSGVRKPDSGSDRDQVANPRKPDSGSDSASRDARLGPGQVGARSGARSGPAPVRAGSGGAGLGLAGHGPGLGRAGPGAPPSPSPSTTEVNAT